MNVSKQSRSSRIAGALLLALLPAIAVVVAVKGRRYDAAIYEPAVERQTVPSADRSASRAPSATMAEAVPSTGVGAGQVASSPAVSATGSRVILANVLPPAPSNAIYRVDEPSQFFDAKTIYEKIDGAAPEYLDLGFRELMTQAYAPLDARRFGCELFVYDMGAPQNAKKIYEQQRGQGAKAEEIGESGYRFGATWFFHQGLCYVIVTNSDEGADAERFSEQLARGVALRIASSPSRQ